MDAQLAQVLDKLAAKLGIAVDVLWAALMRQAPISGALDLVWCVVYAAGIYWTVRYVRMVYEHTTSTEDRWERWDEISWLPCGIVVVIMFILGLATLAGLSMTAASFFNPEYWALMKIINK